MPRRPKGSVPALVHHKPSNRARVRINCRDFWLGKWGSPESRLAYERLITEYLATGRVTPVATSTAVEVQVRPSKPGVEVAPGTDLESTPAPDGLTVVELAAMYLEFCQTYYRDPDGKQTSTYGNALQAARALRPFDDTLAAKFGPRRLGMIRDSEAAAGRPRVGCNAIVKSVRRLFQWAESQELVPRGTHNSLKTVEPLRRGTHHSPRAAAGKARGRRRGRGDAAVPARDRRGHGSASAAHRSTAG